MKEEPVQIIDDYLSLVRSHLPPSAAEDVINELRDYIVDAATELGEGAVTTKSAKRAVARMGAPSEVAREYAASLVSERAPHGFSDVGTEELESVSVTEELAETDSDLAQLSAPSLTAMPLTADKSGGGETLMPSEARGPLPVEPTTYKGAFFRTLAIAGLFALVISLTLAGVEWLLLELPAAILIVGMRLIQLHRRRDGLMRVAYSNPVKKILSIPRKLDPFVSQQMMVLDLSFTAGLIAVLLTGIIAGGFEPITVIAGCGLLCGRGVLVGLRANRRGSASSVVVRVQLVLQLATAMMFNLATAASSNWMHYPYYAMVPFLMTVTVVVGSYMLSMSTMQVDYLWGVSAYDEFLMSERGVSHRRDTKTEVLPAQTSDKSDVRLGAAADVRYSNVMARALCVLAAWTLFPLVVVGAIAFPFGPQWWILFVAMDFVLASAYVAGKLMKQYMSGAKISVRSGLSDTPLRALMTFPEAASLRPSGYVTLFDLVICVSMAAGAFMAGSLVLYGGSYALCWALAGILSIRSYYCLQRAKGRDPASFAKRETITVILNLLLADAMLFLSTTPGALGTAVPLLVVVYSFLIGPMLLYLLLATAQDVWWVPQTYAASDVTVVSREPPKQEVSTQRVTERTEMAEKRPALRVVSAFFSWLFWMFYSLALLPIALAAVGGTAAWTTERVAVLMELLGFTFVPVTIALVPIAMYLAASWTLLKKGRFKVLIRHRSRAEALVDTIATLLILIVLVITLSSTSDPASGFRNQLLLVSYVLLVAGLVVRLSSDVLNLVGRDSRLASTTLRASCILIMTGIGALLGEVVVSSPLSLSPSYFGTSLTLAALVTLLGIQAVTSKMKFRRPLSAEVKDSRALSVHPGSGQDAAPGLAPFHALRSKAVSRSLVWPFTFFLITLFVVDRIVQTQYPAWDILILVSVVYTALVGGLTLFYFSVRRTMLGAAEADTVIGRRGRAEAAVDLVLCVLSFSLIPYYYNTLYFGLSYSPLSINGELVMLFITGFAAAPIFIGIPLRAAADVASIVTNRRVIPRTVFLISCVMLLWGLAFIIPAHVMMLDAGWTALWLAISALLNLQVVTSLAALDELSLRRPPTVIREAQKDGYPAGMVIPTN